MNAKPLYCPVAAISALFANRATRGSRWLRAIAAAGLLFVSGGHIEAADTNIITKDATLQKLADGFSFTEGPACDAKGNVFFTDQPNDRIMEWSAEGKLSTFLQPCGRANGLCFDHKGNLWACADETNALWRVSADKKITVVLGNGFEGKHFNGPNDVWIRPDGGVYFTDPYYKRPYWKRGPKEQEEHVYFLSPDAKKLTRVVDNLKQPNGIIGTPDGKILYVADIGAKRTFRYDIQSNGSLKDKKLFCEMGSDGMTIDNEGNVYLTGNGVSVFDPEGKKIAQIPVPEGWTANICFGGKDRHTLFITASKGIYGLRMRVKGVGSQ